MEVWEVLVVGRNAPRQLPHPFDRGKLGTVWRQEKKGQCLAVLLQEFL